MIVLGFKSYQKQGQQLADAIACPYKEVLLHRFPDGESKITLPDFSSDEVVICETLDHPNHKLVELYVLCSELRNRGVKKITLVAPYLCYMRQDAAFHSGEIITQKFIGKWLGEMIDKLVTVDPHLHRINSLDEVIPNTENISLTAAPLIADFLKQRPVPPMLFGPDEESQQWVQNIAELAGLDWAIAEKVRHGDHQVSIELPEAKIKGRRIIIIDDIASTGRTIANTARLLKRAGAELVKCFITHPLFIEDAEQALINACVTHIWSSDSITHHSNVISLTPLLAQALKR